ncbi:MAG: hypothetical protein HC893_09295 [Chloroflexaceae bacterium]|nr:hypothetical protein [Chloroflexaceae bacterium]
MVAAHRKAEPVVDSRAAEQGVAKCQHAEGRQRGPALLRGHYGIEGIPDEGGNQYKRTDQCGDSTATQLG